MNRIKRHSIFLAAVLLIACAAAWPLISGEGLLNTRGGGDSPFLLQRLHQLETAVRDGHFPVRWMPDANYGYGYPFFNFYAPFAFYIAFLFRWAGAGLVTAVQLSQLAAFLTAAAGMLFLGRRWFRSEWAALLASAAYTLAPFHLVNVYVRGDSIAEFWAMAWFPWVILGLEKIGEQGKAGGERGTGNGERRRAVLGLGVAYAGLVLSHNISAMIFSPFVLLHGLFLWVASRPGGRPGSRRFWQMPALIGAGLALGLALSSWFWLPALGERGQTRLEDVTAGYFDYAYNDGYHFRSTDLVQRSLVFDPDVAGGRAFRMGLIQAAVIAAGALAILFSGRVRRAVPPAVRMALLVGLALATFMITPYSIGLWARLPLLPFTQFPWRFLSVQAFWGAGLTGAAALWLEGRLPGRARPLVLAGLLALFLWSSLAGLRPDFLPLVDGEITAGRLAEYEWFTGNIGTTISAEYLSRDVNPRLYTSPWLNDGDRWPVRVVSGQARLRLDQVRTQRQHWSADVTGGEAVVVLPLMAWPGWRAQIDGRPVPLAAAAGSGLVELRLPEGRHEMTLSLGRTSLQRAAELVALLALVAAAALFWTALPGFGHPAGWLPPAGAVLLFLGIVWLVRPAPPTPGSPRSWDFAQMGFRHARAEIPFGNGAVLRGIRFEPPQLRAGETLTVTLDWAAVPAGETRDAVLSLTTPGENFYNFVPSIAAASHPIAVGPVVYTLVLPEHAPAGLALPRLTLSDDSRSRTPAGEKRGDLFLDPVRILPGGDPAAVQNDRPLPLDVRPVHIAMRPQAAVLDVQVQWWSAVPLAENLMASLRLGLPDGRQVYEAQVDVQPGYGYRPSGGWPAATWIDDWLTLDLRQVSAEPPFILLLNLYEAGSGRIRLTRRLGELAAGTDRLVFTPNEPRFTPPANLVPVDVELREAGEPLLALAGYQAEESENQVALTLYWRALGPIPDDYTHFVHLLDPATGRPVAQHDAMPVNNSYPTSQWVVGEIVADPAVLNLADLPAGRYQIAVGFYREVGGSFPRLTPFRNGKTFPGNAIPLFDVRVDRP